MYENKEYDVTGYEAVPSSIYTLYKKTNPKSLLNEVEIVVLMNKDKSLVSGPDKIRGEVLWHSEDQLLIRENVEVIPDRRRTNESIYYIHIPTLKKTYSPTQKI